MDHQKYLDAWQPDFRARAQAEPDLPRLNRSCQDICCLVVFIIFLLAFFGIGGYAIATGWSNFKSGELSPDLAQYASSMTQNRPALFGIIFGMTILALLVSFVYICLVRHCPRCMIWTSFTLVLVSLIAFAVLAFISNNIVVGVIICIIVLLYLLIFCCCWCANIDAAVVIAKLAGRYLSQNPSIYCLTFLVSLINIGFLAFFVAALVGLSDQYFVGNGTAGALLIIECILEVFFMYYFHYVMVFVIACSVAFWYFRTPNTGFCTSFGLHFYNIGSFTFSSIVITIIKILQALIRSNKDSNVNSVADCLVCCCLFCLQCCLSCIEGILKTLNHYSTILSALTGEDFCSGAKSAAIIIWNNIGLFSIVELVESFFFFTGILFTVGIPVIIASLITVYSGKFNISETILVQVIVFFLTLVISLMFLSTLTEVMSSLFVFYCTEERFEFYGVKRQGSYRVMSVQNLEDDHFDDYEPRSILRAAKQKYFPQESVNLQPQPVYNNQPPVINNNPPMNYSRPISYQQQPPINYGQQQYGQPQYGQPQYGQPQYGQPPYGQPNQAFNPQGSSRYNPNSPNRF